MVMSGIIDKINSNDYKDGELSPEMEKILEAIKPSPNKKKDNFGPV